MKCPSFERLLDYIDGHLTEAESARVAAHLSAGCRSCAENRDWYERTRKMASSDDSVAPAPWVFRRALKIFEHAHARPHLVERIGSLVASLVFDSFARPALSGVRSTGTASRQLLYRAGDYSIDLQVAALDQSRAGLIGQILRDNEPAFESVAGLSLELMRGSDTVAAMTTNERGEFSIGAVAQGDYDLRVEMAEGSIVISGLPVTQPR